MKYFKLGIFEANLLICLNISNFLIVISSYDVNFKFLCIHMYIFIFLFCFVYFLYKILIIFILNEKLSLNLFIF
jgi:hypothetical protein